LPPGRLELLNELVPAATIIAILVNPTNPIAETVSRDMQAAARARGLQVHLLHASTERELDAVFATLVQLRAGGLVIGSGDPFFNSRSKQLGELSVHQTPFTMLRRRSTTREYGSAERSNGSPIVPSCCISAWLRQVKWSSSSQETIGRASVTMQVSTGSVSASARSR